MPDYRSASQLSQYLECGEAYRLQRIERVPRQPAYWFIQGTATHAAIEHYEYAAQDVSTAELFETFEQAWLEEEAASTIEWPDRHEWMTGSKKPAEQDGEERFTRGWEQVLEYVEWSKTQFSHRVARLPETGEPAVEVPFELDLDGVKVVGKIDQILTGARVRDFKGGNRKPSNNFQLGIYGLAATEIMGKPYTTGEFYYAKVNNTLPSVDLRPYTRERLTAIFQSLDKGIQQGLYMPHPVDGCKLCGVRRECWVYNDTSAEAAA